MSLVNQNLERLREIKELIKELPKELYSKKLSILNGASVGQHFRHIIEFYACLSKGLENGKVSYDHRQRDVLIEDHVFYAISALDEIIQFLTLTNDDRALVLFANYNHSLEESTCLQTSLFRELAYALDHTVHHMAIVKIALLEEGFAVDDNLGVAASTIRSRLLKAV